MPTQSDDFNTGAIKVTSDFSQLCGVALTRANLLVFFSLVVDGHRSAMLHRDRQILKIGSTT